MKIFKLFIVLLTSVNLAAQEYAVSLIPEDLKKNANAVVRYSKTEFIIENKEESTEIKNWAVTIFNERGAEDHNIFEAYYDNFSKIKRIEGFLYNANGKLIKKLRMGDIKDTALSGFSYDVSDGRIKHASFDEENYQFPYTIEFSYERIDKNMMFFPRWMPYRYDKTAIQYDSFKIISKGEPFRIKEVNQDYPGLTRKTQHPLIKEWEITNAKAVDWEHFSRWENLPKVLSAPINFIIEDYSGSLHNWEDISSFYYKLNHGRDEIPERIKTEVAQLITPEMTQPEKVKAVYQYMQKHTRYMSVQLGIGGWQTIDAMEVAEKGYGDCKALTNYTLALLKSIEIEAYPALIYAGRRYDLENFDFPSMKFNHVIACVPIENDTIWLECTSQTNPMGYQGDFTGNRKALVIKESGGQLVDTKKYSPQDNQQKRNIEVWLELDGKAKLSINTTYGSIRQEKRALVAENMTKEEQLKFLQQSLGLNGISIKNFSFDLKKTSEPQLNETIELEMRKLGSLSGKRLFLKPNLIANFIPTPLMEEERLTNVFLDFNKYSFEDTDEITFYLPENLKAESIPKTQKITSPFGEYFSSTERKGNTLIYKRSLSVKGGIYAKETYPGLVNFIKSINRADKQRVVFVNGDT